MPDMEKVKKGLECCIRHGENAEVGCGRKNECPYEKNGLKCWLDLNRDALALIKEQEAVEPKQVDLYGKDEWWGLVCVCPDCKAEWMSDKADTHFCPKCGKKVKWE